MAMSSASQYRVDMRAQYLPLPAQHLAPATLHHPDQQHPHHHHHNHHLHQHQPHQNQHHLQQQQQQQHHHHHQQHHHHHHQQQQHHHLHHDNQHQHHLQQQHHHHHQQQQQQHHQHQQQQHRHHDLQPPPPQQQHWSPQQEAFCRSCNSSLGSCVCLSGGAGSAPAGQSVTTQTTTTSYMPRTQASFQGYHSTATTTNTAAAATANTRSPASGSTSFESVADPLQESNIDEESHSSVRPYGHEHDASGNHFHNQISDGSDGDYLHAVNGNSYQKHNHLQQHQQHQQHDHQHQNQHHHQQHLQFADPNNWQQAPMYHEHQHQLQAPGNNDQQQYYSSTTSNSGTGNVGVNGGVSGSLQQSGPTVVLKEEPVVTGDMNNNADRLGSLPHFEQAFSRATSGSGANSGSSSVAPSVEHPTLQAHSLHQDHQPHSFEYLALQSLPVADCADEAQQQLVDLHTGFSGSSIVEHEQHQHHHSHNHDQNQAHKHQHMHQQEQQQQHLQTTDLPPDTIAAFELQTNYPDSGGQLAQADSSQNRARSLKGRRGRPRKKSLRSKNKVNGKLWEFIRDLLLSERTNPSFIRWERREDGVFKFVQSDRVAKMWGERKQNPKMTYEKLSRAMRYYYKSKVLLPVFGRRLVYKFGPNATGWLPGTGSDSSLNSNSQLH